MAVLVIADHDNKTVRANVANTVTAAGQTGLRRQRAGGRQQLRRCRQAAAAISRRRQGAAGRGCGLRQRVAEDIAPLVVTLAPDYSHIVMAANSVGKNVAPRVAAMLDVAQISEAIKVVVARHLRAADLRRQRPGDRADQPTRSR